MRYQRVELHNHSTESDGEMTAAELMRWAEKEAYGVVALTDHNTCSGHEKAERTIQEEQLHIQLLKGIEVTTFYGHILALGIEHMIDFTNLDPRAPEKFLRKIESSRRRCDRISPSVLYRKTCYSRLSDGSGNP